jgi:hypothetical protein
MVKFLSKEEIAMDPVFLALTATSLLAPYIAKAGKVIMEDVSKQLPDVAGKLWDKIAGKIQGKPAAQEAARDLVSQADDKDNQEAFAIQLRKLLKDDPAFAAELEPLVQKAQQESISIRGGGAVATHGGIAVQGNVQGNIIMGDNNNVTNR